jgi:hypothetical protein
MTMIDDPIVTEVRKVRDRHAAKFNYDLDAIYRDLKQKEESSGRSYVGYPPRLCGSQPSPANVSEEQTDRIYVAGRT